MLRASSDRHPARDRHSHLAWIETSQGSSACLFLRASLPYHPMLEKHSKDQIQTDSVTTLSEDRLILLATPTRAEYTIQVSIDCVILLAALLAVAYGVV